MGLKRGLIIFICISLIISISFVSAGSFSDWWKKTFGKEVLLAPGDNLVVNGDFIDNHYNSWNFNRVKDGTRVDYHIDGVYSNKSLYIGGNVNIFAYQSINLESGKNYNLSFIALRQGQPNSSIAIQGPGESWQLIDKIDVPHTWNNFRQFSKIITVPSTGSYKIVLQNGNNLTTWTNSYFDNIRLVETASIPPSTIPPTPTTTPIIINPSFETGLTGWYKSNDSANAIDAWNTGANAPDGANVLRIRGGGLVNQNPSQLINAQGKTFNLTFSAIRGPTSGAIVTLRELPSWNIIKSWYPTNNWQKFSDTFTLSTNNQYILTLELVSGGTYLDYAYYDNIKLLEMSPTPIPPAPPIQTTIPVDTDSDATHPNGKNYDVKGTCTSRVGGRDVYHIDICDSDVVGGGGQKSWLWEQFVNSDGNCDYELYFCEDDKKTCSEGKCIFGQPPAVFGNNILVNPSFETGLTGWYKSNDSANAIDAWNIGANAPDGANVLRIRGGGLVNQNPSQLINAQGKTFNLTFSAIRGPTSGAIVTLRELPSWNIIKSWYPTNNWQKFSDTFTLSTNNQYILTLELVSIGTYLDYAYYDNVSLREMTSTTSINPIPDSEKCISKSNINKKVPSKTREKVGDKVWYCDPIALEYIQAKENAGDCVADYECQSNVCIDSKCTSIRQELEVQGRLIKEIWCWIQGTIPGGDTREECRTKFGLT